MSKVYPPSLSPGSAFPGDPRLAATWIGNSIDDFLKLEYEPGVVAKKANRHCKMYHLIRAMDRPNVVELGVDIGISNIVLQAGCLESGGHLYSIDIRDCSAVASSPICTFIQSDDKDIKGILEHAPELKDGIDFIFFDTGQSYVDTIALLDVWFKYVKQYGCLAFDAIDNTPYKPGRHSENRETASRHAGVTNAVLEFFYANEDDLLLEFHLGHTGLAIMRKLMPRDKAPNPAVPVPDWPPSPKVPESARMLAGAIGRSLGYRLRRR